MVWRVSLVTLLLGLSAACIFHARPLPTDCQPVDGDVPFLRASPESFSDLWVASDVPLVFYSGITRSDCGGLRALRIDSVPDWVDATLSSVARAKDRQLRLAIDTAALTAGETYVGEVRLVMKDRGILPVSVTVVLRRLEFNVVHLGAVADGCPHVAVDGSSTTACDFAGADAALQALEAPATGVPLRILVYDAAGERAFYRGPLSLPADTWMSAAPGVSRDEVVIFCQGSSGGVIQLAGDRVKLNDLTIAVGSYCGSAIRVAPPDEPSGGHLIENIIGFAMEPEKFEYNGIEIPVYPGSDSTVRNSLFFGYWELKDALERVERTRIIGNTFVYFQFPKRWSSLRGSRDLTIANNVYIGLSEPLGTLFLADSETVGLELSGNSVEGFGAVIHGLDSIDGSNRVAGNRVGILEMQSPIDPRFLADADPGVAIRIPGEGVSLDGEILSGRYDILPGAYQTRSDRPVPRPDHVVVGPVGCSRCDVSASVPNEIQRAVWSAWPGSVVKIEPNSAPYAGNVAISWPVKLKGMGSPDEVVLENADEDDKLFYPLGRSLAHGAMVVFIGATHDRSSIENLTLFVVPGAQADRVAVVVEPPTPSLPPRYSSPGDAHAMRRVRIVTPNNTTAHAAIEVGERFILRDSLIIGGFKLCLRTGLPDSDDPTTVFVYNVTCRLTNSDRVLGAFSVAGSINSRFLNLAIELAEARPVFFDPNFSGAPSFRAAGIAVRGYGDQMDLFSDAGVDIDLDTFNRVNEGELFFVGSEVDSEDSHLKLGAVAMDSAVPLADWSDFETGAPRQGLDGVPRDGVEDDCGAYEQGK